MAFRLSAIQDDRKALPGGANGNLRMAIFERAHGRITSPSANAGPFPRECAPPQSA
jgi:hypothetical protein